MKLTKYEVQICRKKLIPALPDSPWSIVFINGQFEALRSSGDKEKSFLLQGHLELFKDKYLVDKDGFI